ncbi:hypothetical protein A8709_04790 [Paenibacillus pectinilyticus]|uniref:Uncharacterized protein n=1 Tax=Paenibacillus pectinilyticus TaxID=512399 RepID=A0A1C0ZSH0_9BACL|nr:hypothetical protein [Paenibacillus pectinilyticus]OCT11022.1 hypothetical protein A8709_04790 [Paenibacillus pectinilyticus]
MTTSFTEVCEAAIVLKYPCYGLMNIKQIDQHCLDSKYTPFKAVRISVSQMDFISYLSLPTNENVIWCFQFNFHNEAISLRGVIRQRSQFESGFIYTVVWLEEESYAEAIVQQVVSSWESEYFFEYQKSVRRYEHAMRHAAQTPYMDVSC